MTLDPDEWRYGRVVVERLLGDRDTATAVRLAGDYARRFPGNPALGTLYGRALLTAGRHRDAAAWLDRLEVLPAEGSAEARSLYREAHLMVAVDRLGRGEGREALTHIARAREWPERLGAGKPYPADVDERLEDWLEAVAFHQLRRGPVPMAPPVLTDSVGARVLQRAVLVMPR